MLFQTIFLCQLLDIQIFSKKNNYIPLIPEVSIKRFYRRNLLFILENYQLNESLILILSSWRPDGKLVAAGYSSGLLAIRHIESAQSIHTEQLDAEISWILDRPPGFISKVRCIQNSQMQKYPGYHGQIDLRDSSQRLDIYRTVRCRNILDIMDRSTTRIHLKGQISTEQLDAEISWISWIDLVSCSSVVFYSRSRFWSPAVHCTSYSVHDIVHLFRMMIYTVLQETSTGI